MGATRRDRVRAEARRLLAAGVSGQVFPGGAAAVSLRELGKLTLAVSSAGKTQLGGGAVSDDTMYDLASLTKPIVATIALRLVARGAIGLDTRADQLLADARGTPGGAATLEALLTHRAGLAPWGGLYLDVPHDPGSTAARRWILAEACRRPEERPKGRSIYSDLGYIIVGEMLARAGGADLEDLLDSEIRVPLGIRSEDLLYAGALTADRVADFQKRVAPTERDDWRGKLVRGEVHDENCSALGGVSGHAGIFGTAAAVATFGRAWLEARSGRGDFLPQARVVHALAERPGGTHRLGWDGKAPQNSAAGRRASPDTFGHLGFTGTSVFCDPVRDVVVTLLTNRVCPSRANEKIKGFRPAFHDGVLAAIDG